MAAPIWMMGPSRPTAAPLPIERAEASDLIPQRPGEYALIVKDGVHDFGHTMPARFRRETW